MCFILLLIGFVLNFPDWKENWNAEEVEERKLKGEEEERMVGSQVILLLLYFCIFVFYQINNKPNFGYKTRG